MLRRMKEDHLVGLPEKQHHLLDVEMPETQARARHPHFGDQSFDIIPNDLLERKRRLNGAVLLPTVFSDDDLKEMFAEAVQRAA
jgi:hypothetical protein